jgi:succinyl-diaminopimelate desuccinylase
MSKSPIEIRRAVLEEIAQREQEFVEFCSQVVQVNTENPPGPTAALARFVASWLEEQGIASELVEPQPNLVSLVSTFNEEKVSAHHFMFNGHLDVFPADDPGLWDIPPFEGRIADGKIHGRGVADMKGGLCASIIAYSLLQKHGDVIPARVSLMTVADEETGGLWGTGWLLDNRPEYVPDACLIGEPCSPDAVRVGEKGISWLQVRVEGRSYHGSLGLGDNCILRMAEALTLLKDVTKLKADIPEAIKPIIERAKTHNLNEDTKGRADLLEHPSFNIGRISGGIKVNIAPRDVVAEVDIRAPFGMIPDDILRWARRRLDDAGYTDVSLELPPYRSSPNYTDPKHPLAQVIVKNAEEHYGVQPTFTITTGATDGRYFRQRDIPTIIYGPRPQGVGGLNEYITIQDFLAVVRTHATSALDYLQRVTGGQR